MSARHTINKHARKLHRLTRNALAGKRIIKHKHAKHITRGFFILVVALCGGSLAVALAATRPSLGLQLGNQLHPGTTIAEPAPAPAPAPVVAPSSSLTGQGSWYALGLPSPDSLTCASRTFGRGSYLEVTNLRNGKKVTCLVNDYGPEVWTGRVIDLSRGSFRVVESLSAGTIPVQIRLVAGPAVGFNIDVTQMLGSVMGYNLCRESHAARFCDNNRQASAPLK